MPGQFRTSCVLTCAHGRVWLDHSYIERRLANLICCWRRRSKTHVSSANYKIEKGNKSHLSHIQATLRTTANVNEWWHEILLQIHKRNKEAWRLKFHSQCESTKDIAEWPYWLHTHNLQILLDVFFIILRHLTKNTTHRCFCRFILKRYWKSFENGAPSMWSTAIMWLQVQANVVQVSGSLTHVAIAEAITVLVWTPMHLWEVA